MWEWGKVHEVTRRMPEMVWEVEEETGDQEVDDQRRDISSSSFSLLSSPRRKRRAAFVSCGRKHVGMTDEDGQVFTWGCGFFGRLGLGDEVSRSKPTWVETLRSREVPGTVGGGRKELPGTNQCETLAALRPLEMIISIACGGAHTICITSSGRVFSFGFNRTGQCGVAVHHGK